MMTPRIRAGGNGGRNTCGKTSFQLCHGQGHYLYLSKAQSEQIKCTRSRSPAPCWRACHPSVKVAEVHLRVTSKGLKRAEKPPDQLEASFNLQPRFSEEADRTGYMCAEWIDPPFGSTPCFSDSTNHRRGQRAGSWRSR